MNIIKLQQLLEELKYVDEMAKQHKAVVSDKNYQIEILEAILEE